MIDALLKKSYGTTEGPLGFTMRSKDAKALETALADQPSDLREEYCSEIQGEVVEGYCRRAVETHVRAVDSDERTDKSLITTSSVDRDGEVILPNGLDFKQFMRNPVVTWNHDYRQLPVGRALWVNREKSDDPKKDGFVAKTQYMAQPEAWQGPWFAGAVWELIKEGVLRAKSIGFIPLKVRDVTEEDIKKRPDMVSAHRIIEKATVVEYAVATVPVNPDALVSAVRKSAKTRDELDWILERFNVLAGNDAPDEEAEIESPPMLVIGRTIKAKSMDYDNQDMRAIMRSEMGRMMGKVS